MQKSDVTDHAHHRRQRLEIPKTFGASLYQLVFSHWELVLLSLFAVMIGHFATHKLYHVLAHFLEHNFHIGLNSAASSVALAGIMGFIFFATVLYKNRLNRNNILFHAAAVVVCAHLVTFALMDISEPWFESVSDVVIAIAGLIILLLMLWRIEHHHEAFEVVLTLGRQETNDYLNGKDQIDKDGKPVARIIKALVIFVSRQNPGCKLTLLNEEADGCFALVTTPKGEFKLKGDLSDIETALKGSFWNWQQLLRAIAPFITAKDNLKTIMLIGSPPEDGKPEDDYLSDCKRFLTKYLPGAKIETKPNIDFENFENLDPFLRDEVLEDLIHTRHIKPEEIVIEVTGGQKTASAAGVVATLHNNTVFQYVQTGKENKPYIYNLRLDGPPKYPG